MTRPDAETLSAALATATGRPWTVCVTGAGALWLWPTDGGARVAGRLALVDCWPRGGDSGARRVVLRDGFSSPSVVRDVPQGRGWPARAAAAVVAMLGER